MPSINSCAFQVSDIGHQTQSRSLRRHGGNGVFPGDALPFSLDINLVSERIGQPVQEGNQIRIPLHGEFPVPGIRIRKSIGSDLVTAWESLPSVIPVSLSERAFERRCVGVGQVRAAAAPFGESVFESQFRDHADFGCVGERGALVEDHLVDDIGAVGRQGE